MVKFIVEVPDTYVQYFSSPMEAAEDIAEALNGLMVEDEASVNVNPVFEDIT